MDGHVLYRRDRVPRRDGRAAVTRYWQRQLAQSTHTRSRVADLEFSEAALADATEPGSLQLIAADSYRQFPVTVRVGWPQAIPRRPGIPCPGREWRKRCNPAYASGARSIPSCAVAMRPPSAPPTADRKLRFTGSTAVTGVRIMRKSAAGPRRSSGSAARAAVDPRLTEQAFK